MLFKPFRDRELVGTEVFSPCNLFQHFSATGSVTINSTMLGYKRGDFLLKLGESGCEWCKIGYGEVGVFHLQNIPDLPVSLCDPIIHVWSVERFETKQDILQKLKRFLYFVITVIKSSSRIDSPFRLQGVVEHVSQFNQVGDFALCRN